MTFKYDNVYINETSTITGPYESEGPFSKLYDKSYNDFYFKRDTIEQGEIKLIEESVDILLNKAKKNKDDIDVFISGDLSNQLGASNYASVNVNLPYLGIYNACATSAEGIIIASNMIEGNKLKNIIVSSPSIFLFNSNSSFFTLVSKSLFSSKIFTILCFSIKFIYI